MTLIGDGLGDGAGIVDAQRMATARRLVAGDEHVIARIEEDQLEGNPGRIHVGKLAKQLIEVFAVASIAYDGKATTDLAVARQARETDHVHDQRRRKVVDAEVAQVLERVHGFGSPCPAHARDDDHVGTDVEGALFIGFRPRRRDRIGHGNVLLLLR